MVFFLKFCTNKSYVFSVSASFTRLKVAVECLGCASGESSYTLTDGMLHSDVTDAKAQKYLYH